MENWKLKKSSRKDVLGKLLGSFLLQGVLMKQKILFLITDLTFNKNSKNWFDFCDAKFSSRRDHSPLSLPAVIWYIRAGYLWKWLSDFGARDVIKINVLSPYLLWTHMNAQLSCAYGNHSAYQFNNHLTVKMGTKAFWVRGQGWGLNFKFAIGKWGIVCL